MAFNNYLEDENDKPYFKMNSLAYYYDKMEGFAKAVEGSAKALNLTKEEVEKRITAYIEQNKNELDQRLAQWDGKLETFDSSVETLLSEWVDDGTLTPLIDSTLIDQRLAPVTAQLADKAELKHTSLYWTPPEQPPARKDNPGFFADGFNWKAQDFLDNLFEPLRLANPKYVTRDNMGKDSSGLYDTWRYYFTPENYKKTIIIGTCIHGSEVTPMMTMYRFLHYLINEWEKHPQFNYIRNNVRLIFIPFQNPWGASQSPRKRQNSNGVDLNRNFDFLWSDYVGSTEPFGHDYKGTAPFSELESQYIRNTLQQFKDATAYLDFHNLGTDGRHYVVYNSENAQNQHIYNDLISNLTKDITNPIILNETRNNPSTYTYAEKVMGIVSGNPEWADKQFGGSQYNSIEMTKALEWFGNIILQHARQDLFKANEPFVIENYYSRGSSPDINLNVDAYAELTPFAFSFDAPSNGLVLFEGTVTIKGTDAAAQNFFSPRLGQVGTSFSPTAGNTARWENYTEGALRQTIPFYAQTHVKKTGSGIGQVGLGLRGYTTAGTCTIYRYRGRITFIPSDKTQNFSIYKTTASGSFVKEF